MTASAVRGPLLIPREGGAVDFHADGLLVIEPAGTLGYAGPAAGFEALDTLDTRASDGVLLPPLLDIHTHIPQHPIRGDFTQGVPDDAPRGKLLAGLERNVFPAEIRCAQADHAQKVVEAFRADTLAHGVVGGAAYMTTSPVATRIALELLPDTWSVGLVLMNQNCPADIHTDEATVERDLRDLAERFGPRVIVTDRFAVAVGSDLRRQQSALAGELGLRTQTHLNEQAAEKRFVEDTLYPDHASYTDVYRRDGLLDHRCILAHCIEMRDDEWQIVADTGSFVAHCPTSNLHLGSRTMPLDEVIQRGIPYALATDVGASPTVSMLAEMRRFLRVHAGRSAAATACEALYRATLAPSIGLGLDDGLGRLEAGRPASFIEVQPAGELGGTNDAEHAARSLFPADPDQPDANVRRVTLHGQTVFDRDDHA